jgi:hypothetical protein
MKDSCDFGIAPLSGLCSWVNLAFLPLRYRHGVHAKKEQDAGDSDRVSVTSDHSWIRASVS